MCPTAIDANYWVPICMLFVLVGTFCVRCVCVGNDILVLLESGGTPSIGFGSSGACVTGFADMA